MRTASIAVLSWTGAWADAAVDGARLDEHATPRGIGHGSTSPSGQADPR